MKLKTAARIHWWFGIMMIIIMSPLSITYQVIEYLYSKAECRLFRIVNYVGNKLLLRCDEYKSGVFKNPNVKNWTAMQVWKQLKRERSDLTDEDRD